MRNRRAFIIPLLLALACGMPALAQDAEDEKGFELKLSDRFLFTGYGFATWADRDSAPSDSFTAAFVPILLFRVSDKLLFEAEVEIEYEDETDTIEDQVEYAQLDWLANDYLTVVAGKFLAPFGTYVERLHPAWINKLPSAPLPYRHGQSLVPFGQVGLQLRGGVPFGDGYRRFTYSLFVSNGFEPSAHGHVDAEPHDEPGEDEHATAEGDDHAEEGDDHAEEEADLVFFDVGSFSNDEVAVGGRVSVMPAQGCEIGVSYVSGGYGDAGLDATTAGIDVLYHHDLFELRGEWLDNEAQRVAEDGDPLADQNVEAWYLQSSLRLSIIPVYFFNKLELVGRFARLEQAHSNLDQTSLGLNYYFTGSRVLRVAWERLEETGLADDDSVAAMFAYGF